MGFMFAWLQLNLFLSILITDFFLNANRARRLQDPELAFCTFCTIRNVNPLPSENFKHLFMECPSISNLLLDYFRDFCGRYQFDWELYYMNIGAPNFLDYSRSLILNIEILTVAQYVFGCKRKKMLPFRRDLNEHTTFYHEVFLYSKKYKSAKEIWDGGPN